MAEGAAQDTDEASNLSKMTPDGVAQGADEPTNHTKSKVERTVVLVGRTGNGKSATGNSILGRKSFISKSSTSGVTRGCEVQQTAVSDGEIVNVIDTPGLFDSTFDMEYIVNEIANCVYLARDGIHAILLVFSVKCRFTNEEEAVIAKIRMIFGDKIVRYMIVVFTGGDELEEGGQTLDDFLGEGNPKALKNILQQCNHRHLLFDNKTKEPSTHERQRRELLTLLNLIVAQNEGRPYTHRLFTEAKHAAHELSAKKEEMSHLPESMIPETMRRIEIEHAERMKEITDKLREMIVDVERKLSDETSARQQAEDQFKHLRDEYNQARGEIEHLKNKWHCVIQ